MKKGVSSIARLLIGYLSAIGAVTMNATSSSCVQALQGAIPDFELSVIRALVQVILYMIGGKLVAAEFTIKKETIPGFLNLGAAYMAINVGCYGAATYLPLTEVAGIVILGAIVTTFLLSRLLSKNNITKSNIIASLVCVVGITLAIQPSWLFKQMSSYCNMTTSSFENVSFQHFTDDPACSVEHLGKSVMSIGYVLAIAGGVGSGVTLHVSGMTLQGVKPIVKATYAALFCVIGSVAFMFYMEDPVFMTNTSQFMLVSGHAVMSAIASFLCIQAAHYVPGPSLAIVFSFDLVTMLLFQYTIMHSVMPGNYNWIEVVGCLIILFGASIPATLDILAHRAKADELP